MTKEKFIVPSWPSWSDGEPVTVQPPVLVMDGDRLYPCPRVCYDGGAWFLLDDDSEPRLSALHGVFDARARAATEED